MKNYLTKKKSEIYLSIMKLKEEAVWNKRILIEGK
jgi:hypothetical protein